MSEIHSPPPATSSDKTTKPESAFKILIGAFIGAVGTALAGLIFNVSTVSAIAGYLQGDRFPKGAIIFVTGKDCSPSDVWTPLPVVPGHFIVASDGKAFQAGQSLSGAGEKISIELKNLPALSVSVASESRNYPTNLDFINGHVTRLALGEGKEPQVFRIGGGGEPLTIRPPWFALTACQKS